MRGERSELRKVGSGLRPAIPRIILVKKCLKSGSKTACGAIWGTISHEMKVDVPKIGLKEKLV